MKDFLQAVAYASVFLVLFIPVLVSESMFFPYITGKNFAFRILVEIGVASWFLLALLDIKYRPKFSWMAVTGGALLVVMFFANLFGEYAPKSFWSNFERMDGYVTLVHFYFYFLLAGSLLQSKKIWSYFLHTSIAVALYVALYGLGQSVGLIEGAGRVESTLGNAAYMAIYMFFHIFILMFVSLRTKDWFIRGLYGLMGLLFVYILLETGTRGTFIGLVTGSFASVVYLILFGRGYPEIRKIAIGGMIAMIGFAGLFYSVRDSDFVQQNPAMSRIANIDIKSDLVIRSTIWRMAIKGVEERPILGWGQGNFNYVFNSEYDPAMYAQEQWFDRVHNIFFDWLIAGGILGFLAYFGILFSCLYYLLWRPWLSNSESDLESEATFTVLERAVLFGVIVGYFTHNLVVFDNIVSYVFYAIILGIIHSRLSTPLPVLTKLKMDRDVFTVIAMPVTVVVSVGIIYFVNVSGILAAKDIIVAFQTTDVDVRFTALQTALSRDSFADQEIVEQLSQQAITVAKQSDIAPEVKEKYLKLAESEIKKLIEKKPGDARLHVFLEGFYRSIGQTEKAKEQIEIARVLSPKKQAIMLEAGVVELALGNFESMRDIFKETFELDETNNQARFFYAGSLMYTGEEDKIDEIITDDNFDQFAQNDFAFGSAARNGLDDVLVKMLESRIQANPTEVQDRASLAFVYYRAGNIDKAIEVLEATMVAIPEFEPSGKCFIKNINLGNDPSDPC